MFLFSLHISMHVCIYIYPSRGHKGPARKGPGGPTRARPARPPGGAARARPTGAHICPQVGYNLPMLITSHLVEKLTLKCFIDK